MSELPLGPDAPLRDAVRSIEATARRIAVVVEERGRVIGTLTDGDVRRCLLAGGSLQTPVGEAMNRKPVTAPDGSPNRYILELLKRWNIMAVPLVDAEARFVRLVHLADLEIPDAARSAACGFELAVIMAGGEGRRLLPLTMDIPKPMVSVGGVPLMERQVRRLVASGVRHICIAVNYLGHVIEQHFGDGGAFGARIEYLREEAKLGTGGALSLVGARPTAPFLVLNGDVLTASDFASLHEYHLDHRAVITVGAVHHIVDIPFGVIRSEGPYVTGLEEKPSQRYLCNAGIYAVSPEALDFVPSGRSYDMTELIADCLGAGKTVAVFPVHEYWTDIGTPQDLERAQRLFRRTEQNID